MVPQSVLTTVPWTLSRDFAAMTLISGTASQTPRAWGVRVWLYLQVLAVSGIFSDLWLESQPHCRPHVNWYMCKCLQVSRLYPHDLHTIKFVLSGLLMMSSSEKILELISSNEIWIKYNSVRWCVMTSQLPVMPWHLILTPLYDDNWNDIRVLTHTSASLVPILLGLLWEEDVVWEGFTLIPYSHCSTKIWFCWWLAYPSSREPVPLSCGDTTNDSATYQMLRSTGILHFFSAFWFLKFATLHCTVANNCCDYEFDSTVTLNHTPFSCFNLITSSVPGRERNCDFGKICKMRLLVWQTKERLTWKFSQSSQKLQPGTAENHSEPSLVMAKVFWRQSLLVQ